MQNCQTILPMKTGRKTRNRKRLGNAGFTMVEIILVLAIGALLAGGAMWGMNYLSYANTKKCAEGLISALDEVQMRNMTESRQIFLKLFKEGEDYYLQKVEIPSDEAAGGQVNRKKIAGASMEIKFQNADGGGAVPLQEGTYLMMSFSKGSGAYLTEQGSYGGTIYAGDLWVVGKSTCHIIQVAETGKHYIE